MAGLSNGGRSDGASGWVVQWRDVTEGASGWVVQWREMMLPDESIETRAILPLHHGNHVSWWVTHAMKCCQC